MRDRWMGGSITKDLQKEPKKQKNRSGAVRCVETRDSGEEMPDSAGKTVGC